MNTENLKAFIRYGVDKTKTYDKIQLGGIGACLLAGLGCLPAVSDLKNLFSAIGAAIIVLLTVPYFVFILKIPKDLTIKKRVVCDAVNSLYLILTSTISGAVWLSVSQVSILFSVSFVPIIMAFISALGCLVKVKRNHYISKKNNPDLVNLAGFAAIGVFVGKKFYDFFSSVNANMTYDILFLAIGYIAIATIFAVMGTPSFLKMYYLKILRRMDINID